MIATDPLSVIFLGCIVFSGLFLIISTILGIGDDTGLHFAGHLGHASHTGHVGHAGDTSHTSHTAHSGHVAVGQQGGPGAAWSTIVGAVESGLNLYGLLLFLLFFGLLGYLLHNAAHLPEVLTIFFAMALALASALAASVFLARLFLMSVPTELTRDSSQLEGRLGQVSMTVREGGVGEVIFTGATGSRQSVGARSADGQLVPAGTEVVILSYHNGIASVQAWDRFMASVHAGEAPQLESLESLDTRP